MDTEVDRQIERAREVMQRISSETREGRGRQRRTDSIGKRLALIAGADAAILIAAVVVGFVFPLGIFGALLVLMLMIAATLAIAFAPGARPPSPERLRAVELKALPTQTERWLDAQRPALPAPAITLVDQIGVRLETLSPQLAGLDDGTPEAAEIRKLVGEQLPAFVKDYARVPVALRTVARNGKSPDGELVDGLKLIEAQIGELTANLAQGDLDQLATRGRYLEIKYKGDGDSDSEG